MPPTLTFTLILTAELLLLFRLAIPYAWESFIAFRQGLIDEMGRAYEASAGAGEGIAAEARITDGSHCHDAAPSR